VTPLCPAFHGRGEQPGKIDCIGNPRIHAVTGIGNPNMRGVAANEDAPVAKTIGD
jgi:hypothetical protein